MLINIIEKIVIFLLPTQLGLHLWPSFSRVAGIRIDYLSPTIYLLDLFLILYIGLNLRSVIKANIRHRYPLFILVILASINTLNSISQPNTLLWWIRIFLYLEYYITLRVRKITWRQVELPLFLSVVLVIVLQVFQTIAQHSFGGIFYFLGERSFTSSTNGLARISLAGLDFVRAPSYFSHPNSLAGYLLFAYYPFHINHSPYWQRLLILLGILLTFSKAAILCFLLTYVLPLPPVSILVSSLLVSVVQPFMTGISSPYQFILDRVFLVSKFSSIFFTHPLLGVGLGNFIVALGQNLPGSFLLLSKLQPIHNLPLLIISELGVLGVSAIVVILRVITPYTKHYHLLRLLSIVMFLGIFDHYMYTLPQNRLILLLTLAIMV